MDDNLYYAREGQTVKQIAEEHGEDPAEARHACGMI